MRIKWFTLILLVGMAGLIQNAFSQVKTSLTDVKIVMIRHGEKQPAGDNLTCQGVNRSLELPEVIKTKFGVPNFVYVPSLGMGASTKRSRMFQTVVPLVSKYNLAINTSHGEMDAAQIAADLKTKSGTVLLVWEHKSLAPIVAALGASIPGLNWPDDDYDSIWIVTFTNGKPFFTKDKEGLEPSADCAF